MLSENGPSNGVRTVGDPVTGVTYTHVERRF
jgi:hypothetical protein